MFSDVTVRNCFWTQQNHKIYLHCQIPIFLTNMCYVSATGSNSNTWLTLSRCLKVLSRFCWAFLASDRCWGRKRFEMMTLCINFPNFRLTSFSPLFSLPLSLFCAPASDPEGIWWARHRCRLSCFRRWAPAGQRSRSARSGSPETTRDCWICGREDRQFGKSLQLKRTTFNWPFAEPYLPLKNAILYLKIFEDGGWYLLFILQGLISLIYLARLPAMCIKHPVRNYWQVLAWF